MTTTLLAWLVPTRVVFAPQPAPPLRRVTFRGNHV
jgi:hypothetical protein